MTEWLSAWFCLLIYILSSAIIISSFNIKWVKYRISYKYLVNLLYLWFLMQQLGHNYFISCLGFYRSFIYCLCGMILWNGLKCYFLEDFLLAFTKFAMGPKSLVPTDFHTQWKTTNCLWCSTAYTRGKLQHYSHTHFTLYSPEIPPLFPAFHPIIPHTDAFPGRAGPPYPLAGQSEVVSKYNLGWLEKGPAHLYTVHVSWVCLSLTGPSCEAHTNTTILPIFSDRQWLPQKWNYFT